MVSPQDQIKVLRRGVLEILSEAELIKKLESKGQLRIKYGVDPTTPDVHLGHSVVMRKLRQFQDLGHHVILIVGDYTATVGDPSGKTKARPMLQHSEVLENASTYQKQLFQVVKEENTEIVFNGTWFSKLSFAEITKLMSQITVAQMLEREDFQTRYRGGQPISLHEFLYPIMQAYDSVVIRSDVELGGMDQKFNVIRGREMQRDHGQDSQVGLFMPILLGTDGKEKMSKSLGNTIGLSDSPQVMFHKLFSLPDSVIEDYFKLLTDVNEDDLRLKMLQVKKGEVHPNTLKEELALDIVSQYHGLDHANEAAQKEKKVHAGDALPEDTLELKVLAGKHSILELLTQTHMISSNGEGRRLIQNGGITWDGVKVSDAKLELEIQGEHILRVGKRKCARIVQV